ncbi:hypothetical protein [Micromonospora sp. NPDC049171]|uniref:hypothetical protein n=1 Tax=Micromonospora sp. NPDC049171 TaxID=3155770 RepID=UPI0033EEBA7E
MSTPLRPHDPREVGPYGDRSRTSGKISLGINGRGDGKAAGGFGVMFGNVTVATPS